MIKFHVELLSSPVHRDKIMCIAGTVLRNQPKTYHSAFTFDGTKEEGDRLADQLNIALNKITKECSHE
jgi:hypothetical protein